MKNWKLEYIDHDQNRRTYTFNAMSLESAIAWGRRFCSKYSFVYSTLIETK